MSRMKKYHEESLDLIDQIICDNQGEIDSLLKEIEDRNLTGPTYAQYSDSFDSSMENKISNQCEDANIIIDKIEVPKWWGAYKKANPNDKDEYNKRKHCCARFWKDFCDCM